VRVSYTELVALISRREQHMRQFLEWALEVERRARRTFSDEHLTSVSEASISRQIVTFLPNRPAEA
jgi:hypothetical protein